MQVDAIIAGVHGSWVRAFVKMYANEKAKRVDNTLARKIEKLMEKTVKRCGDMWKLGLDWGADMK